MMNTIKKLRFGTHIVCLIAVIIFMYPLCLMLIKSFAVDGFRNYSRVFKRYNLLKNFFSSVVIATGTLLITGIVVSLAAFAFSKLEFRFKKTIYYIILMGMMIPASALIFPLFRTIKVMGLLNTRVSLIFPYATLSSCGSLMILKNYFDAIPNQLMEAARIDGASKFRTFWSVMMPVAKPGVAYVLIQTFVGTWNELQMAMIFITDTERQPLSVIPLRFTQTVGSSDFPIQVMFAALVICLAPIAIFYVFASRFMVAGLTTGAVKG